MPENTTTLSEFADSDEIRRTVNEYATSYDVRVPEDVFDVANFSGYIRYTLTMRNGEPVLQVTPNPTSSDYEENTLLVTGESTLPVPRGIIEPCAPDALTDWERAEDGFTARLDIPQSEGLPGDRLVSGAQSITLQDGSGVVSLPKHPAIADRPACSLQVAYGPDGFELLATLVSPDASATPISDATTLPKTEVPAALVQALDQEMVQVTVFDGGPVTTRGTLLDKYAADYGVTPRGDIEREETEATIALPDAATDVLQDEAIDSGVLRVVADDGSLLLICDSNGTDGDREFEVHGSELVCNRGFADWLNLAESELHWHFHDGTLVGETIAPRPAAPAGVRGFIGEFDGQAVTIPPQAFEAAGLPVEGDIGCIATSAADDIGFALQPTGGTTVELEDGDEQVDASLPSAPYEVLAPEDDDVLLCLPIDQTLVCIPMDEAEARRKVGVAPPEEMADARLHIPEDGKNAFVQQVGEGDPAVGVPTEATEQFDLEEGSKFEIRVGTYNGTLSLYCAPITDEEVGPDVCLGRMLSRSNLRLPIQIVATLSLFERGITWGILWEADGPRLVGLVEGMGAPPLSEGLDVGAGQVYTTVKTNDEGNPGATHYAVTIPRAAFDVYDEHPPGVFIGAEAIEGTARVVLMPVGEADLEIIGAVKLRDHWDEDYYEVTLPKSLAAALGCTDEERASWTFLDGQYVGTIESAQQF